MVIENKQVTEIEKDFNHHIINWRESLSNQIQSIINRKNIPIIVAISRKMPKLLKRLVEIKKDNYIPLLQRVEVITELALPFLFYKNLNINDYEFIIIDDIIVQGSTLKAVSNDIYVSTGKKPHVSCILLHENAIIPDSVDIKDTLRMPRCEQVDIDRYACYIAQLIEKDYLPIDLEFPIFDINVNYSDLIHLLQETSLQMYEIDEDKKRTCVLLDSLIYDKYEPDFKKIRIFHSNEKKKKCEIFAPAILNEHDLLEVEHQKLFTASGFSSIWERTTISIRDKIVEFNKSQDVSCNGVRYSYIRSLCVWANYLLSLSYYIDRLNDDSSQWKEINKCLDLSQENVDLLIGSDLSREIFPDLLGLINNQAQMNYIQRLNIAVPDSMAPESFSTNIEMEKGRLMLSCQSSYERILDGIIEYEHYTNPIFTQSQFFFKRMYFGETFYSFYKAISTYSKENLSIIVNKWIDKRIDDGCLVPKYERVDVDFNIIVWRRYFHAGIKKINNNND